MQAVTTIGLDIAKSVFQVHGVDVTGQVVIRRQLKRRYVLAFFERLPPCLVGIEACASSHHWSRELQALGHTVRLMPPAYVKPYVKRQKNDMADAEAICEAVARANMRFVPTKTPEQQSGLLVYLGADGGVLRPGALNPWAGTGDGGEADTILAGKINLDRLRDSRGLRAGCILFRRNHHRDQLGNCWDSRRTRVVAIEPPPTEYLVRIHVVMPGNH